MKQYEDAALADLAEQAQTTPEVLTRLAVCRMLSELLEIDRGIFNADPLKLPLLKAEAAITEGNRNRVSLAVSEWYGRELDEKMAEARKQVAFLRRLMNRAKRHYAELDARAKPTQRRRS